MLKGLKSNTAMSEGVSRDTIVGWSSIEGCSRGGWRGAERSDTSPLLPRCPVLSRGATQHGAFHFHAHVFSRHNHGANQNATKSGSSIKPGGVVFNVDLIPSKG